MVDIFPSHYNLERAIHRKTSAARAIIAIRRNVTGKSAVQQSRAVATETEKNKATRMNAERLEECRRVRDLLDAEKKRSGLTQKTLAQMIGRSPKLISAICNGRSAVTVNVARSLARVFGVPLVEILPWTGSLKDSDDAAKYADIIDDLNDMSEENRRVALRMIRNLADSQE